MPAADLFGTIEPPSRWRWESRFEPSRLLGGSANSQPQPAIGQKFHCFFATVIRHTHDEAGGNLPRYLGTARLPPGQDVLLITVYGASANWLEGGGREWGGSRLFSARKIFLGFVTGGDRVAGCGGPAGGSWVGRLKPVLGGPLKRAGGHAGRCGTGRKTTGLNKTEAA